MKNFCTKTWLMLKNKFTSSKRGLKKDETLLSLIIVCLKRSGVQNLSLHDLNLLGGIETFFGHVALKNNAINAQIVASLASVADGRSKNINAIRDTYGEKIACYVQTLSQSNNALFWNRISVFNENLKKENAIIRWASAALLHAEFLYQFNTAGHEEPQKYVLLQETISKIKNPAAANLIALWEPMIQKRQHVQTANPENQKKEDESWFISISLDLCGSTKAKTTLKWVANENKNRLQQLYAQYYEKFMSMEDWFYQDLFRIINHGPNPLNFSKLFLIKGVGDEIWIVYPIQSNDIESLNHAMARIMEAALHITYKPTSYFATERTLTPEPTSRQPDSGRVELVDSPVKIYIDLIEDAYEISTPRGDFFYSRVAEYYDPLTTPKTFFRTIDAAKHAEISGRLNLGFSEFGLRKYKSAHRTDYIGHEIDRFFRASKSAKPALITIGNCLYSKLNITIENTINHSEMIFNKVKHSYPLNPDKQRPAHFKRYWVREGVMPKEEMQGIGYDYSIFYIFDPINLRGIYHGDEPEDANAEDDENGLYTDTRKAIPPEIINTACK